MPALMISTILKGVPGGIGISAVIDGSPGADRLVGERGADMITGYAGDDTLLGRGGNDTLYGNDGDDDISGGSGDDTITGGEGADAIDGGRGRDRASYANSDAAVSIDLTERLQHGGEAEGDTLRNVEDVTGSAYDDTIIGDRADNWLIGASGDDTLFGGAGDDRLSGEFGDDVIYGERGRDSIFGDAGADWISGGDGDDYINAGTNDGALGADTMAGGAGRDLFVFGDISHSNAFAGIDTITDFEPGRDRLSISEIVDPDALFLGEAGSFLGTGDEIRFQDTLVGGAAATLVSVQSETSTVPLQILLTGASYDLTADDFAI